MRATFIELPPFERYRSDYLDDHSYRALQVELMKHPEAGDVIPGTGGLRKLRYTDRNRGKGKRADCALFTIGWLLLTSSGFSHCTIRMRLPTFLLQSIRRFPPC